MGKLLSFEKQCYAYKDPHTTTDDVYRYQYLDKDDHIVREKDICSKCSINYIRHMEGLGHSFISNQKI